MAETENRARNVVRRLDFGVIRKRPTPVQKITPAPVKEPAKPAAKPLSKPALAEKRSLSAPEAPKKPVMVNRGFRMDFAPVHSRMPAMAPRVKKPQIAISVSKTTIEVPNTPVSRPVRSRGSMMDFVRRPATKTSLMPAQKPAAKPTPVVPPATKPTPRPVAKSTPRLVAKPTPRPAAKSTPVRKTPTKKPLFVDDDEPLMSDTDLRAALSGFATAKAEEVPRRPRIFRPAAKPAAKTAPKPVAKPIKTPDPFDDFTDDDFGGDGFGDDIDRIEAEIEAEANDFIKEPRPLFEDPLVQLSKAREEQHKNLSAIEKARLKNSEAKKRSPYATLYSTKTPFITSAASLEKRPLSSAAPTGDGPKLRKSAKPELKKPTKPESKKTLASRQTMVMSTPEVKEHNTALIIGIVLTILLGAGVGALIYLVFFQ